MAVYFHKARKCWAFWWRDPQGKRKVKYFPSKAEAEGYSPSARPAVQKDFHGIAQQFLSTLQVRERTLVRYQQEISALLLCMRSPDTSRENLLRVISEVRGSYQPAKAVRALKRLRALCRFAEIPFPPGVKVSHRGKPGRCMTGQEVQSLLQVTQQDHPRYYLLLCILLDTGCRLGEACALNWEDWDGENLRICKSYCPDNKGPKIVPVKTSRSNRLIPLSQELNRLLRDSRGLPGSPICTSSTGRRMNKNNMRRDWWIRVGMGYRIHDLRHTCATFLLGQVDPRVVSKKLGHENTTTTLKIYDHLLHQGKDLPTLLYKNSA